MNHINFYQLNIEKNKCEIYITAINIGMQDVMLMLLRPRSPSFSHHYLHEGCGYIVADKSINKRCMSCSMLGVFTEKLVGNLRQGVHGVGVAI